MLCSIHLPMSPMAASSAIPGKGSKKRRGNEASFGWGIAMVAMCSLCLPGHSLDPAQSHHQRKRECGENGHPVERKLKALANLRHSSSGFWGKTKNPSGVDGLWRLIGNG